MNTKTITQGMRETVRQNVLAVMGLGIGLVMLLVMLLFPLIQSPRIRGSEQVRRHLENARRLLGQYDVSLNVDRNMREVLSMEAPRINAETFGSLSQSEVYPLNSVANAELGAYSKYPEVKKIAQSGGANPPASFTGLKMVTEGQAEYEKQVAANDKILSDALAEVDQAKAVKTGNFDGSQDALVNRMTGMIHYQQGLAVVQKIGLARNTLSDMRLGLKQRLNEIRMVMPDQKLIEQSGIQNTVKLAQEEGKKIRESLETQQKVVTELEKQVGDIRTRLAAAQSRSEAAREAMETLADVGTDLSNPNGYAEFKKAYEQQAILYRQAIQEAHDLEHGTLDAVGIDDSGDYVKGRYEPTDPNRGIVFVRGLDDYAQDLEQEQLKLERMQQAAAHLEENVKMLTDYEGNLDKRVEIAAKLSAEQQEEIRRQFDSLFAQDQKTRQMEDQAVGLFNKAGSAFTAAIAGVTNDEQQSKERTPSPGREAYYYSSVAGDQKWLKGQLAAQQADAQLQIGRVLIGRYQDAQENLDDLSPGSTLADLTEHLAQWTSSAQQTKEEAIKTIEGAIENLRSKAKGQIGEGNWVVSAEIGAAYFMLSVLDKEPPDLALEWYDLALGAFKDKPLKDKQYILDHANMRDYIQARIASETP